MFNPLHGLLKQAMLDALRKSVKSDTGMTGWYVYNGPTWQLPYADEVDVRKRQAIYCLNQRGNTVECLVPQYSPDPDATEFVVYYAELPIMHIDDIESRIPEGGTMFERVLKAKLIK